MACERYMHRCHLIHDNPKKNHLEKKRLKIYAAIGECMLICAKKN